MILETTDFIISLIGMGIYFFIFFKISDGIHRRSLLLISVLAGGIFMTGLDCWEINENFKLLSGILFITVLSRFIFYIQMHRIAQALLLTVVGTLASRLLSSALLMISMGNDFIIQFEAKSEIQLQERIFSQTLLFFLVIIATDILRQQEESLGWREIALILIQLSTCMGTLILIAELSRYGEGVLRVPPGYVCFMSLGCVLVYFTSYYMISQYFKTKREQLELMQLQAAARRKLQYYEHQLNSQQQVRRLYHDMKNHMLALRKLYETGSDKWESYLDSMEQQAAAYSEDFRTGSAVTDALLYEKKKMAEEAGILFETDISPDCIRGIPDIVLCTVLGNGLDNAREAVSAAPQEEKKISLVLSGDECHLCIAIRNKYVGKLKCQNGKFFTGKSDKEKHGFGLRSIRQAVKDCQGNLSIKTENQIFELFVLLPMDENGE